MALSWRNRAITAVALFLEGCALYLVMGAFAHLVRFEQLQMPLWLVLVAMVWGFALSSWILSWRITPLLRGLAGLSLGAPSLLVLTAWNGGKTLLPFSLLVAEGMGGVGLFVGSMLFLLVIWWRGISMSREEVTLDIVRSSFQIGLVVMLAVSVIDAVTPGRIVSGFLVIGFFAVGLAGMALARFSSDSGEEREMPTQWLWPIVASVGVVLLLGLLISGLGLGGLDDVTRTVARAVGAAGYWMLEPVLLLVGLLAGALVSLGNWFSDLMGGGNLDGLIEAQRSLDEFHESLRETEREPGGSTLFTVMKWAAALLGAAIVSWIVYALFRARRRQGRNSEVIETRESLFSLERMGDDLGDALSGLFSGMTARRRSTRRRPRSPRDYYHALLGFANRAGRSKETWETPREHQRDLSGILPADPVARIVDEFQDSHYGAAPPDAARLERLETGHRELEEFLRENPPEKGQ